MPRVNPNFDWSDITDVFVEHMGWIPVVPGSLRLLNDGEGVSFIDDDGDQMNILGSFLVASACKPIDDESE